MTTLVAALFFTSAIIGSLPWMIAFGRGHQSRWAILIFQTFFGWTGIGWVAALVWASTGKSENCKPNATCVQIWIALYFLISVVVGSLSSSIVTEVRDHVYPRLASVASAPAPASDGTVTMNDADYAANTERLREEAHTQEDLGSASHTAAVPPTAAPAPDKPDMYPTSFDCSGSLSQDEYMICTNAPLAMEDQKLAISYDGLKRMASPENRARIVQNAAEQLRIRRETCSTYSCLMDWYHDQEAWTRAARATMEGYIKG